MTSPPKCLLCAGDVVYDTEVAYALIWGQLAAQFGIDPREAGQDILSPTEVTTLWRCCTCDLGFFHPARSGNEEFYSTLDASGRYYHEGIRWDTHVALREIRPGDSVLDFGSGPGRFLLSAAKRGATAAAIELNPVARGKLAELGVQTFGSVEAAITSGFEADVVTAFQTVEHLSDLSVVQRLVRLLAPTGRLIVSVPNRARLDRAHFEVLDVPPHHMTHWSAQTLGYLGAFLGLHVRQIRKEPPGPRALFRHWVASAPVREIRALDVPSRVRAIYWTVSAPVFGRLRLSGHSLMAEFARH